MDFKKQITDLKLVTITEPRIYLKWVNTEKGRDKHDCYERVEETTFIRYINTNNPTKSILPNDMFFKELEESYQSLIKLK